VVPRSLVSLVLLALLAVGCTSAADTFSDSGGDDAVQRFTVEVVESYPHDIGAYTQGLLVDDGVFVESTGQYGQSDLREVTISNGVPIRQVPLPAREFGEGLALVDDRLIQLTWREGIARVYDRETFEVVDEFAYEGEGWGLCLDDDRLVMSDGSSTLTFRDPETFDVVGTVDVTAEGVSVDDLNELECVDGEVYANVYHTDEIVVIDPETGTVTASIDASPLIDDDDRADVLNGIAHDVGTDAFYLTGKYWPTVFEVRFVAATSG
jgi:glutaminyl-peptide cyclotransferase